MSLATVNSEQSEGGVRDALVEGVADEDLVTFERSPIAILHLVASAVALALLAAFMELFPQAHLGFEADLDNLTGTWGPTVGALADAVAATAAILAIVGAIVAARLAHVDRHIVAVVAAAGLAGASVAIVERIGGITPGSVVLEEWGLVVSVAGVAVVSASFSVLAVTVRRWATATIVVGVLVGAIGADVSIGARLMALVAGVLVGSLVAIVLGTPSRAISRIDLAEAMERSRLPIEAIEPHPGDARGSLPW
ncbi:MAG TPA: hypothetical protein VJM33_18940, partial [Microthrixaceae bacterium]|nr:hypothetical protein [Microthrixaceae bacterium]